MALSKEDEQAIITSLIEIMIVLKQISTQRIGDDGKIIHIERKEQSESSPE